VSSSTFSEQWYIVSDLKLGLLPSVDVQKRVIRNSVVYILTEPYSQKYFQVSQGVYELLARLTPRKTVDEIWNQFIDSNPDKAPGQEEVIKILSQLHHANLLYVYSVPDSGGIFAREQKKKKKELWNKFLTFLFIKIPIWNPNGWLDRVKTLAKPLLSIWGLLIWLSVVIAAVLSIIPKGEQLLEQSQGLLALENIIWLYICLASLKILHELAHSLVCKYYGGDVHTLGIMFLIFVPLPYMDATSSWSFRQRKQRVLVSSAGMITELFLGAIAALIWSNTGSGLIHSLAFNVMLIGTVSSLVFNGNPLLRYDAYYILSDMIDIPNLSQKSTKYWYYLVQNYLMGSNSAVSPALDKNEKMWFLGYGFLSFFYRLFITIAVTLIVLDQYFILGVLAFLVSLWIWVIQPSWKLFEYLLSAATSHYRLRAIGVTFGFFGVLLLVISQIPYTNSTTTPGVIEAVEYKTINSSVGGYLDKIYAKSGSFVKQNDPIAKLKNFDLETEIVLTTQLLNENKLLLRKTLWDSLVDMEPVKEQVLRLEERLGDLKKRQEDLNIYANISGVWVAPNIHQKINTWFTRGEKIGELVSNKQFRFTAVVSQDQAKEVFGKSYKNVSLRLYGQADKTIDIDRSSLVLIPVQRDRLASAALGYSGGGNVATSLNDDKKTLEGFFEIRVLLKSIDVKDKLTLMHGQSGKLKISFEPEPIWDQFSKWLQQLLQTRYGLTI